MIAAVGGHVAPIHRPAVEVAGIADLGGFYAREFGRLPDVLGIDRLGVLGARAMAGFAGLAAVVLFGLPQDELVDDVVPVVRKSLREVLVAERALLSARVRRGRCGGGRNGSGGRRR